MIHNNSTHHNIKWTNESLDLLVNDMNIKRLDDVNGAHGKIKVKCLKDNYEWYSCPNSLKKGKGCKRCAGLEKLNNIIIDNKLSALQIKRLDDYKNIDTKIRFQCLKEEHHNYVWKAIPYTVLKNIRGCPYCSKNKSEKEVFEIIKNNLNYEILNVTKKIYWTKCNFIPKL